MTNDQLTAILATRAMGWRVSPTRFLMGEGGWKPRWKFQPMKRLADAVRLLEAADPEEYAIQAVRGRTCVVRLIINGKNGQARDDSSARAITNAVAQALGVTSDIPASKTEVERP